MRRVSAAAFVTLLSANSISTLHAQDVDANGAGTDASIIDSVVVLGTARENTTALTSTAPVNVITPEQLRETGAVTINQALSKLHPSFNFPQGQNAVKGQGVRSASLRGVGPAYTLVLVNGKRRHLSAQLSGTDPWPAAQVVDINTIPVNAIERVEVLRDGAAAQYGSDAIAGVINIVLRKDASGGELGGRYGGYSDGGGDSISCWETSPPAWVKTVSSIQRRSPEERQRRSQRSRLAPAVPERRSAQRDVQQEVWPVGPSDRDNWTALVNAEIGLSDSVRAYGWANYADKSAMNYVNPERIVKANTRVPTATVHFLIVQARAMQRITASKSLLSLLTASCLLAGTTQVGAHHAFAAEFDADKPLDLKGTVTKVKWVNPHSWLYFDVDDADGTVTNWGVEFGTPNPLAEGLKKTDVRRARRCTSRATARRTAGRSATR